jgi:electron transfer flavoprotein beta subunit
MKILVCISNVPDTTTKVKFTEGNKSLDTAGIQWLSSMGRAFPHQSP